MPDTQFLETEALLAYMRGDDGEAERIIDEEMLPGERASLSDAARKLADRSDRRSFCVGCGKYAPPTEGTVYVGFGHASQTWHRTCREASRG